RRLLRGRPFLGDRPARRRELAAALLAFEHGVHFVRGEADARAAAVGAGRAQRGVRRASWRAAHLERLLAGPALDAAALQLVGDLERLAAVGAGDGERHGWASGTNAERRTPGSVTWRNRAVKQLARPASRM